MTKRTPSHFVPEEDPPRRPLPDHVREFLALVVIGVALYLLVALATFHIAEPNSDTIPRDGKNLAGTFGYHLAHGLVLVFGRASFLLAGFTLVYGVLVFARRELRQLSLKVLGVVVLSAMVSLWLAGPAGNSVPTAMTPYGPGGRFGANLSPRLQHAFGGSGRVLILVFGILVSFLLATEWLVSSLLRRAATGVERGLTKVRSLRPSMAGGGVLDESTELGDDGDGPPAEDGAARPSRRRRRSRGAASELEVAELGGAAAAAAATDEVDASGADADDGDASDADAGDDDASDGDAARAADADAGERELDDGEPGDGDDTSETAAASPDESEAADDAASGASSAAAAAARRARADLRARRKKTARARRKPRGQQELPFEGDYPFPPIELFREPIHHDEVANQDVIDQNASAIEQRLASFKIGARVVRVSAGPAVTQYEVRIQEGVKVSKIVSFEADLAAALKAVAVRVVAPIPGKDTVGIEVPNAERQIVVMRELLERFGRASDFAIPLFLGKDVKGEPIIEDLTRMPHVLIAGTTGSGKSVCINTILLSILMTRTPKQVRLILIDPKMVELQAYKAVPHLSCDVVTNMKKAPGVLEWAVDEMEKRYALFSAAGVNHILSYNRLGEAELERRLQRPIDPDQVTLPYQVLIIDELADLMNVAQKEVEESIQRLAQKSRAVGLHVILATQRPSTDVITGVIKANLPCQIAFKVNRKIDSRVILDSNGAEKLLGHGDMLYVPPAGHRLIRAQGTFVSDEEIQGVVQFLSQNGPKPTFLPDLVQSKSSSRGGMRARDDMYDQAVEVILGQQRGSATLLQRALAVGYTRATRLLELMEEDGLVGAFNGSRSREVLLTIEEWRAREAAMAEEMAEIEGGDGDEEIDGDADEDSDEDPNEDSDEESDEDVDADEEADEDRDAPADGEKADDGGPDAAADGAAAKRDPR